jgi:hypothetical protein
MPVFGAIEYDTDLEIVQHYRREAEFQFAHSFAEYESLPEDRGSLPAHP